MQIHILGICGTFMAGLALLAKQQGHHVTGSDANVYPPMSTQLREAGIAVTSGFDPAQLHRALDCVIVGNALRRGDPAVEYLLDSRIPYTSGPQWLAEHVLHDKHVLAVSGTHGKTTTSSLLAWLLESAGLAPGFLIGGVPENFGVSARLGESRLFVVEADEYDSAFFDKRPKFMHYRPDTLIINNLEFDHADIFENVAAIQRQFHYLIRTVPSNGLVICPAHDEHVAAVLEKGIWTPQQSFGIDAGDWQARHLSASGDQFDIRQQDNKIGTVSWGLLGRHNVNNALAAIAAASHVGVDPKNALAALTHFRNVKRRLEQKGSVRGVTVYDDFAHHPTAISTTLAGLRGKVGEGRILVVLELGSYTMRTGVHKLRLTPALSDANAVFLMKPAFEEWGVGEVAASLTMPAHVYDDPDQLFAAVAAQAKAGDHILVMSNTGFANQTRYDTLMALLEKSVR